MVSYCAAFGCRNTGHKDRPNGEPVDISFHVFPIKYPKLLRKWLVNLRRANFTPNRHTKICSVHFAKNCFLKQKCGRRTLKPMAVPTLFIYSELESSEIPQRNTGSTEVSRTADKFRKYFDSLDITCQSEMDGLMGQPQKGIKDIAMFIDEDEAFKTEDSGSSSDESSNLDHVSLEQFMNENLPEHSKNSTIEDKIDIMKRRLMSTVMKRSLKRAQLESELKAAQAKRDYYESKKLLLSPISIMKKNTSNPISLSDIQELEDLKIQVLEEELAAKTEKRVLQREVFEVEVEATTFKRRYYSTKNSLLVFHDT